MVPTAVLTVFGLAMKASSYFSELCETALTTLYVRNVL